MIAVTITLAVVILVLFYATFNLFRKNVKLEKTLNKQQQFIEQFQIVVNHTDNKLKEIDERGSFESDDEIGWFFNSVKELQALMNEFSKTQD